jgi:uncharacterized protein (TIGR02678 family)
MSMLDRSPAAGVATRADAQDAFVGLLTTPLVSARVNAVGFGEILRHRVVLADWAARLGYRLVITGTIARLHRDPAGPQLTAAPPAWDPPSRRVLALTMLTAAACERTDATTTVQELSDEVRALSVSPGARITAYDPDRRAERQAFSRGLDRLTGLGILIRRTSDETLLRKWEEDGTGVGAGFEIERDALLQFTDPYTVQLVFADDDRYGETDEATGEAGGPPAARAATRSQRLLRILVEDTALLYADLHPVDAEYARGQRSWLAGQAADLTGGTVEIRAEGMLLRLPEDRAASAAATAQFPVATAAAWFALKTLDAAITGRLPDQMGRITLTSPETEAVAARVYRDNFRALTKALAESPARMHGVVEQVLAGLGLIRVTSAGWVVLPVAARYRDPKAVWELTMDDAERALGDAELVREGAVDSS